MINFFHSDCNNEHEVSLFLFTKCNLNCDFCFQNHTNDIDIEAIKNIPKLLEDNYPEELKNKELTHVSISIKGGELFSDDIPDNMFDIYEEVCNNVILLIRKYLPDIKFNISWISNGVYTKHDRVLNLFNNIKGKSKLCLSYDHIGRFRTKEQFELFEKTFWYFYSNHKIKPKIGYTLTKTNIDIISTQKDDFLDNIPEDILIDPCYYISNMVNDPRQPHDDDLFNFYKWAIDNNKYHYELIKSFLDSILLNKSPDITCVNGKNTTYYLGKIKHNCEMFPLSYNHYFGYCPKDISKENITKLKFEFGINKRGCLYCEYKELCSGMCWCSILLDEYKITECFLKRTIKYLYDHPEIKDRYLEYDKKGNIK